MRSIAIVDFSYFMYMFRRSPRYASLSRVGEDGQSYPIGHLVGMLRVIGELALSYGAVILALDSVSHRRYSLLPSYKQGRHEPTGDPFEDYKIFQDRDAIISALGSQPGSRVYWVKHDGLESDDIIASYLAWSPSTDIELSAYFSDNDILATPGRYHWFRTPAEAEADRSAYIQKKYGFSLEYLPPVWKTVRGDSSDNISSAIPRFPSKLLVQAALELPMGSSVEDIIAWLSAHPKVSPGIKEGLAPGGDVRARLELNYAMVCPELRPVDDFSLYRVCGEGYAEVCDKYQLWPSLLGL